MLYSSNFGNQSTAGQETSVNIESAMFECILKPLIKRLIDFKFDAVNQENLVSLEFGFCFFLLNSVQHGESGAFTA